MSIATQSPNPVPSQEHTAPDVSLNSSNLYSGKNNLTSIAQQLTSGQRGRKDYCSATNVSFIHDNTHCLVQKVPTNKPRDVIVGPSNKQQQRRGQKVKGQKSHPHVVNESGDGHHHETSNRYHVLNYQQVTALDQLMQVKIRLCPRPITTATSWHNHRTLKLAGKVNKPVSVVRRRLDYDNEQEQAANEVDDTRVKRGVAGPPRCHFVQYMPVIEVELKQLIRLLRDRLKEEQLVVREIRLTGGAASCIIDNCRDASYNDLDLVFNIDLSSTSTFDKIKSIVLATITQLIADSIAQGCESHLTYFSPNRPTGMLPCCCCRTENVPTTKDKLSDLSGVAEDDENKFSSDKNDAVISDLIDEQKARTDLFPKPCRNPPTYSRSLISDLVDNHQQSVSIFRDINSSCNTNCLYVQSTPPMNMCQLLHNESIAKLYIQKMTRIHKPRLKHADVWSLFSLGHRTSDGGNSIDVKFVDRMHRQFEFTVDSFQVVLNNLLSFYDTSSQCHQMTVNYHPTVVAEAMSGSYAKAYEHLSSKLIVTPNPEEIRGGGLLKYCKLLTNGFRPPDQTNVLSLERYMCSRYFIDFSDILSQYNRLAYFLTNHFEFDDPEVLTFLQILHEVISHSTICLMSHERNQSLQLVRLFLQQALARLELEKSVVHFDDFSSPSWQLDDISYGSSKFPKEPQTITCVDQSDQIQEENDLSIINDDYELIESNPSPPSSHNLIDDDVESIDCCNKNVFSNCDRTELSAESDKEAIDAIDPSANGIELSEIDEQRVVCEENQNIDQLAISTQPPEPEIYTSHTSCEESSSRITSPQRLTQTSMICTASAASTKDLSIESCSKQSNQLKRNRSVMQSISIINPSCFTLADQLYLPCQISPTLCFQNQIVSTSTLNNSMPVDIILQPYLDNSVQNGQVLLGNRPFFNMTNSCQQLPTCFYSISQDTCDPTYYDELVPNQLNTSKQVGDSQRARVPTSIVGDRSIESMKSVTLPPPSSNNKAASDNKEYAA